MFHPSSFHERFKKQPPIEHNLQSSLITNSAVSDNCTHSVTNNFVASQKVISTAKIPDQVHAADLFKMIERQNQSRLKPFLEVTNKCYKRLLHVTQCGQSVCRYDVPLFVAGQAMYDVRDCTDFVACHLRLNGFEVKRETPTQLLISWSTVKSFNEGPSEIQQTAYQQLMTKNKFQSLKSQQRSKETIEETKSDPQLRQEGCNPPLRPTTPTLGNVDLTPIHDSKPMEYYPRQNIQPRSHPPCSSHQTSTRLNIDVAYIPDQMSKRGSGSIRQEHISEARPEHRPEYKSNSADELLFKSINMLKPSVRFSLETRK